MANLYNIWQFLSGHTATMFLAFCFYFAFRRKLCTVKKCRFSCWTNWWKTWTNWLLRPGKQTMVRLHSSRTCQASKTWKRNWTHSGIKNNYKTRDIWKKLIDSVVRSNQGNNFTWCRDKTFSKTDHIFVCENILKAIKKYDTIWDLVNQITLPLVLK